MRITISDVVNKSSEILDNIADTLTLANRLGLITPGLLWYFAARDLCERLSNHFNVPFINIAVSTAILSPMVRWENNMIDAYQLLNLEHEPDYRFKAYGRNVDKALNALYSTSPMDFLTSVKVDNFAKSMIDPGTDNHFTVDVHMLRCLFGEYQAERSELYKYYNTAGKQSAIRNIVKIAAREHKYSLSGLQSVLWVTTVKRTMPEYVVSDHIVVRWWRELYPF